MADELGHVEKFSELTPTGSKLNYLLSDEGRVYASARSWSRALQVPDMMAVNFETGLERMAILKKDSTGGALKMTYAGTVVYRWHAVAAQLRSFDREFAKTGYQSRPPNERRQIEEFHKNYERLTNWGYDLQERAIASILNKKPTPPLPGTAVNPNDLVEAVKRAIAPRLKKHDERIAGHEGDLDRIREAVPTLRDPAEFIPVKQAIQEQGLDPSIMPLHPRSLENLSGLTGQLLKDRRAEQGACVAARLDGVPGGVQMNTYRRGAIYAVLTEIMGNHQGTLSF